MRIALLSYEYPPDTGFGGIGTYAWYHARALAKIGHLVHVFAGAREKGEYHSEHEGVKVTRVLERGFTHGIIEGLRAEKCWWAQNRVETAYGAYAALRRALEKESFDMVEFPECGADGALVTTLLDVPTCVKFHSPAKLIMGMYEVGAADIEATSFFEQIAINQATLRTSCSLFLAEEVVRKMNVKRPVHVVPNGIDLELFDRDEGIDLLSRHGLPKKDAVTVFFANRLERRKGIHLVQQMCFHVLQKYPHVHFCFAGDDNFGVLKNEIQPFIEKQGHKNRFHYFGKLTLPEVRSILKRVDIHLLPSLWENAPYSCLEAMSAGRAIVASDCGGIPELIEDGQNGLLARNDDAKSFIAGLERLIEDRALRERLGAAARKTIEARYTDVGIARRSVDVYRRALIA
jgi:glycosyltransferase involved in cell wall biosynthesis